MSGAACFVAGRPCHSPSSGPRSAVRAQAGRLLVLLLTQPHPPGVFTSREVGSEEPSHTSFALQPPRSPRSSSPRAALHRTDHPPPAATPCVPLKRVHTRREYPRSPATPWARCARDHPHRPWRWVAITAPSSRDVSSHSLPALAIVERTRPPTMPCVWRPRPTAMLRYRHPMLRLPPPHPACVADSSPSPGTNDDQPARCLR